MMKHSLLGLLLFFVGWLNGQNVLVSAGNIFEGEPYLAINPTNPQHMVAAWMGYQWNQKIVIKSCISLDGGTTWSTPTWQSHQQIGNTSADVSLAFNAQGELFMSYVDYDNVNFSNGNIICRKSVDGGLSWESPVVACNITSCSNQLCIDRPWLVINPLNGAIVITSMNADQPSLVQAPFHPYLSISTDNGLSFSTQFLDSAPYLSGSAIKQPMPSPAYANDGLFMAIYPSYEPAQSILPRVIEVQKTPLSSTYSYQVAFQGLGFGANNDTLKAGPHLSLNPNNSSNAAYFFVTDVFGDPDIAMIEKNGSAWSAPVRVNNDVPNNGIIQDLVWADYDTDGDLGVCWRDRRAGLPNNYQTTTQIYCRIQHNGNWEDEFIITPMVENDSILLENGNDFLNVQFENNELLTLWGDVRSGTLKIYLNRFNQLDSTNQIHEIPTYQNAFPNPSTAIFEIPASFVQKEFTLLDANGKLLLHGILSQYLDLGAFENGIYFLNVADNQLKLLKN